MALQESRFYTGSMTDPRGETDGLSEYFQQFLSSGVCSAGTNLQVSAQTNSVTVNYGEAMIGGYLFKLTDNGSGVYALPVSSGTRIDRVVLQKDAASEFIGLYIKQGTVDTPPTLVNNATVSEISLAKLTVSPSEIVVTDEREDPAVCGLVRNIAVNPIVDFAIPSYVDALSGLYIGVKAYGCIGDGITDDTSNFQAAINGAVADGKTLYIDPGTYLLTARLFFDNPVTLIGGNHDTSILKFELTYHTETAYDLTWWEESNAAIVIRANNCFLSNFTMVGGTSKYNASTSHGIIYHYPNSAQTSYLSSERAHIDQVDIKFFKNSVFTYGGWNRFYTCCHFMDSSENGMKWAPLELGSVGNWSGSGDVIIACQLVGNLVAGLNLTNLFESTFWNCVFEYNDKPIIAINCNDVTFKNCWNEANTSNIQVTGCAKFEGGYNILPSTVDHTVSGAGDIVVFEGKATTQMISGSTLRFNQQGGIITKGVELSAEMENMLNNPGFMETSGGTNSIPSMLGWSVYGGPITALDDPLYLSNFVCEFDVSGLTSPAHYGFRQDITVEVGKTYNISVMCMTPDRSTLDAEGLICFIAHKNGAGEVTWSSNVPLTMIGNNNWEEKTCTVTPTGDDAVIYVGFGCAQNGHVFFATPSFSDADALITNNVFTRIKDEDTISFTNMSGVEVGTVPTDPTTKQNVAVADLHAETVEAELGYLEGLAEGALPSDGVAADSNKLDGKDSSLAATGDTIPVRDASGNIFANAVGLSVPNATIAATHYMVETGSDGYVRPKTLANVKAEIVVASEVLTKIKTVGGAGSGLDADTVDGVHAATIVQDGAVMLNTNPFGGRKLYINSVDNAMWAADLKWDVVATFHPISYGGETYPKLNPDYKAEFTVTGSGTSFTVTGAPSYLVIYNGETLCAEVTTPATQYQYTYSGGTLTFGATVSGTIRAYSDVERPQYLDSPVSSTPSASILFNGNYENYVNIPVGSYAKIRISPSADGKTPFLNSIGYSYGKLFMSYYSDRVSEQAYYRTFNRAYRLHGIGWKIGSFSSLVGTTSNRIDQYEDNANYGRSVIELIVVSKSTSATYLTQVDWQLVRPNMLVTGATLVKHGINQLYNKMQWRTKAAINAEITPEGLMTGVQLRSTAASGTAPLIVDSPTLVTNLNADKLDGNDAVAFAAASHAHTNYVPYELPEGSNLRFGPTTGSKIGTSATEKFAFWNAAPVVQPSHIATVKDNYVTGELNTETELIAALNDYGAKINSLITLLETLGLSAPN